MTLVFLALVALAFGLTVTLSSGLLTYVGTRWFCDQPDARKIHKKVTPRYGGIAFGLSFLLIAGLFFHHSVHLYWYFFGMMVMFLLGGMDDLKPLSWNSKLLVQLSLGLVVIFVCYPLIDSVSLFGLNLGGAKWVMATLFYLWFIGLLNSVNLIDGMDGLAGGSMLLICLGASAFGVLSGNLVFAQINLLLAACLQGFLLFNSRPAKFFMGDSGSLLLGFHLACLPVLYYVVPGQGGVIDMTPFLFLSSYFIVDTLRVFLVRLRQKQHPLKPDNNHFHHKLYKFTTYNSTLMVIYLIMGFAASLAIIQTKVPLGVLSMVFFILVLVANILVPSVVEGFLQGCQRSLKQIKHLFRLASGRLREVPRFYVYLLVSMYVMTLFYRYAELFGLSQSLFFIVAILAFVLSQVLALKRKNFVGLAWAILGISVLQIWMMNALIQSQALAGADYLLLWALLGMLWVALAVKMIHSAPILLLRYWTSKDMIILSVGLNGFLLAFFLPSLSPTLFVHAGVLYATNRLYH